MTWRRRGPLALFITIGVFLLVAPGARAARVDCGVLLKAAAKAGVTPTLYLDADYGITRLESGGDYCLEPIEEWRLRGLHLKSSGKTPPPQPEAAESPAPPPAPELAPAAPPEAARKAPAPPPAREPAPAAPPEAARKAPVPPPARELAPAAPPEPARAPPPPRPLETGEPCDRALDEFWRGTVVAVRGVSYRLDRVYTIDLDSDNRVDDVGFRLKAQGKPDLVISYLRGDLPGGSIPDLRLSDEGVIERLCFGSLTIETAAAPSVAIPDLAAETRSRMKIRFSPKESGAAEEAEAAEETAADEDIPLWMWVVLGLAVLMMGGGGTAWFFLIRGQADDEDEEDGEEDEEDD